MSKRVLLILLPLLISLGVLIAGYQSIKPRIRVWLAQEITSIATEKSPYTVELKDLNWSFFFPEIELIGIQLIPKKSDLPLVKIESMSASLDILSLFGGRLALSTLFIESPDLDINIDLFTNDKPQKQKLEILPIDAIFEVLEVIPLSRVAIKNGQFLIFSKKADWGFYFGDSNILATSKKQKLSLQVDLQKGAIDFPQLGNIPLKFQTEVQLTKENLDISRFILDSNESTLQLSGSLPDFKNIILHPKVSLDFEFYSQLNDWNQTFKSLSSKPPTLDGIIRSSGKVDYKSPENFNLGFKLLSHQLQIGSYIVGEVTTQGQINNDYIEIPELKISNDSGQLQIDDTQFELDWDSSSIVKNFEADFKSENLDLQLFLKNLGLGKLPLDAFVSADGNCSGDFSPAFFLNCQADLEGHKIEVQTGDHHENVLVHLNQFLASGKMSLDKENVKFQADLKVGENQGKAQGQISYREGFNIQFSTPEFNFKHVPVLAGLNIEGLSSIEGSTWGDSHAAEFKMNLAAQEFFFENFYLGNPRGELSYKKGFLNFKNVAGQIKTAPYNAEVEVNLNSSTLKAKAQFPNFEVNDLMYLLRRIYVAPVEISGHGSAKIEAEGPFSLGKMTYQLTAGIHRGTVAGELFDQFDLGINSQQGHVVVEKAIMNKAKNIIQANGTATPDGMIDIKIKGEHLSLEESDHIARTGSDILGRLDFNAQLSGFVLEPDFKMNGQINNLLIEEKDYPSSQFQINYSKDQVLSGNIYLFGSQFFADFRKSLKGEGPYHLKLQTKNWNYTPLFALIGGGSMLNDYESSMTSEMEFKSKNGGFWKSTGRGTISDLHLQRGKLSLKNPSPISITMDDGSLTLDNFLLNGNQTFLSINSEKSTEKNLDIDVAGELNLRLLHILAPFLEETSGTTTITAHTSGSLQKPLVLGEANLTNGFVKVKGFPHSFEKILSQIEFSQSKININSIDGFIGGGTFTGSGDIVLLGSQNYPIDARIKFEDVTLNLPDRVRTQGEGQLRVTGSWFPFKLEGQYTVLGGYVDKELESENAQTTLKQSIYLPKVIKKSNFEALNLDIDILIKNALSVKNSMVDGAVSGNLNVKGPPTAPILTGTIQAEKGSRAQIKEKSFELLNATVKFQGEAEINPELYVVARSRIAEYDVNMLIQGPAKEPNINLSSIPPLPESDLRTLLVMGVTSQSLEKSTGTVTSEKVNKGIAAGLLTQFQPVKQLQKSTGVELQIYATDDTKSGSVQKVTLSKKLSEKVKAAATQSTGSKAQSNEYTLQYNFTDSLSAVGRYEDRKYLENSNTLDSTTKQDESIMGLDLEYKKEFK